MLWNIDHLKQWRKGTHLHVCTWYMYMYLILVFTVFIAPPWHSDTNLYHGHFMHIFLHMIMKGYIHVHCTIHVLALHFIFKLSCGTRVWGLYKLRMFWPVIFRRTKKPSSVLKFYILAVPDCLHWFLFAVIVTPLCTRLWRKCMCIYMCIW